MSKVRDTCKSGPTLSSKMLTDRVNLILKFFLQATLDNRYPPVTPPQYNPPPSIATAPPYKPPPTRPSRPQYNKPPVAGNRPPYNTRPSTPTEPPYNVPNYPPSTGTSTSTEGTVQPGEYPHTVSSLQTKLVLRK